MKERLKGVWKHPLFYIYNKINKKQTLCLLQKYLKMITLITKKQL